ncbi:hypothetical protein SKAU_G00296320 [Synaphobranchus kaupii]|uniref:Ninjurin-1 n=1 Tax=Synaphobranchus kaupii TaxID=118154 RepID=A0A9Q1EUT8_SYNKA|nr:hypothetical protein SKAU_G00296320 [Synaphobranchus kaupii]
MASEVVELKEATEPLTSNGDQGDLEEQVTKKGINKKKRIAVGMLDVALLMANATQLKAALEHGPDSKYYTPVIALVSVSLILQIIVGVLLVFIVNLHVKMSLLGTLENVITSMTIFIVVINIFITVFAVQ